MFDGRVTRPFTAQDHNVLSADTPFAWIDVRADGPHDPEVAPFLAGIGFEDPLVSFTSHSEGTGMFQQFAGNLVGATWATSDDSNDPVLVHLVWNPDRMITIRCGADKVMATVKEQIDARGQHLFAHPTAVPGVVMEIILNSVDRCLTQIAGSVDALDGAIISSVDPGQLEQLRAVRSDLAPWARVLPTYLDNVNQAIIDPTSLPGMDATGAQYLQAYSARVQSTVSRVGGVLDAVRNAAQDYQTEVANRQGQRINQLTIVSIVFLPVTFLTGYFGMNFQWLVNSTQSFGIWILLGVLLPIAIVLTSVGVLSRHGFTLAGSPRRGATRRSSPAESPR